MIHPNNDRLDYGQLVAPPDGYALDLAVGTTYSLDLDALVGICLALGLSAETDTALANNPVFLLEALRTTGDKIALFCEGGQIYLPGNVTPLYILLEKMVYQTNAAKRRRNTRYPSFHPKFWLIRYVDKKAQPRYRVVVLSRNLTFDRSWDVAFSMDGVKEDTATEKNEPIIDFLTYLTDRMPSKADAKLKQKNIRKLMKELPVHPFRAKHKGVLRLRLYSGWHSKARWRISYHHRLSPFHGKASGAVGHVTIFKQ